MSATPTPSEQLSSPTPIPQLRDDLMFDKPALPNQAMVTGTRTEQELIGICKKVMLKLRREMVEYLTEMDLDQEMYDCRALMAVAVAQIPSLADRAVLTPGRSLCGDDLPLATIQRESRESAQPTVKKSSTKKHKSSAVTDPFPHSTATSTTTTTSKPSSSHHRPSKSQSREKSHKSTAEKSQKSEKSSSKSSINNEKSQKSAERSHSRPGPASKTKLSSSSSGSKERKKEMRGPKSVKEKRRKEDYRHLDSPMVIIRDEVNFDDEEVVVPKKLKRDLSVTTDDQDNPSDITFGKPDGGIDDRKLSPPRRSAEPVTPRRHDQSMDTPFTVDTNVPSSLETGHMSDTSQQQQSSHSTTTTTSESHKPQQQQKSLFKSPHPNHDGGDDEPQQPSTSGLPSEEKTKSIEKQHKSSSKSADRSEKSSSKTVDSTNNSSSSKNDLSTSDSASSKISSSKASDNTLEKSAKSSTNEEKSTAKSSSESHSNSASNNPSTEKSADQHPEKASTSSAAQPFHHPPQSFECPTCGKKFKLQFSLKRHLNSAHGGGGSASGSAAASPAHEQEEKLKSVFGID